MYKVFYSVGHGKQTNGIWDCGCTDGPYEEADICFPIVGVGVETMRQAGVEVGSDWDTGNDRNINYCVRDSNRMGADVYVSTHVDWDKAPSGVLLLVASAEGERLARCIKAAFERYSDIPIRGIMYCDHWEVMGTDGTAVILEQGGIRSDIKSLLEEVELRGKCAAYGVLDYLGVPYVVGDITALPRPVVIPSQPQVDNDEEIWGVLYRQYFIHICNYKPFLEIDNIEGPVTKQGYYNAQRGYGITADGEWGIITQGHAQGQILVYQTKLQELGFYKGGLDGIPGKLTIQAVRDFQRANGLDIDGCIGAETFALLIG